MPESLPLFPSEPNYRVSVVLAGTLYVLDVRWNGRDEAWYLDVSTEDGNPIRTGIKVVLGALLGGRVVSDDFPLGVFQAVDTTNAGAEAGFDDLGDRVQIYFYSFDELG